MSSQSEPLAIIPARVGSKGIPGKNWKPLVGMCPVARAVQCCKDAGITNIVVTSDAFKYPGHMIRTADGEIIENVRPLYAPAPLHTDTCSMVDVVLDVLDRTEGDPYQPILLVQPTQPLRVPIHLIRALDMLGLAGNHSVASVVEVEPAAKLYYEGFEKVAEGVERRQNTRTTYMCDGTVYAFDRTWFQTFKSFRGPSTKMLHINPRETCKLDTPFDWEMAELRLRYQGSNEAMPRSGSPAPSTSCLSDADNERARLTLLLLQEIQRISRRAVVEVQQLGEPSETE